MIAAMIAEQQPGRENPPFYPTLGKCKVGASLMVGKVEEQSIAHRGAGRHQSLHVGRFAEQRTPHELA